MTTSEILMVAAVLAAFLAAMALFAPLRRRASIGAETARKSIHIGMGLITLSFPWIFNSPTPVFLLGGIATGLLLAIRRIPPLRAALGGALYDIHRSSCGDLCFPVAVALVFWLSRGDPSPYGVAVLLLALADSAAAFAGGGKFGNQIAALGKSDRGSLAFFLTAVAAASVWLNFCTHLAADRILLVATPLGLVTALVERFSARGFDNLFVPLTACLLLPVYLAAEPLRLAVHAFALAVLVLFFFASRRFDLRLRSAFTGCLVLFYVLWTRGADALRDLVVSL